VKDRAQGRPVRLYHYSQIEPNCFKTAFSHYKIPEPNFEWIDLYTNLIKGYKIVVRGALDFSLKSIVNSLKKLGKLDQSYQDSEITSGLQAMVAAFIASQNNGRLIGHPLIQKVISYNRLDCETLYGVLTTFEKIIE
jgi:hypothetical protein